MMSKFYLDNKPYLSLSTFFISLQEWRDIVEEKKYIVYRHTFPNKKVYIGITCQIPRKR